MSKYNKFMNLSAMIKRYFTTGGAFGTQSTFTFCFIFNKAAERINLRWKTEWDYQKWFISSEFHENILFV